MRGIRFKVGFFTVDMADEDDSKEYFQECENHLRQVFHDEIKPSVESRFGKNDHCALDEAFNNWTDSLCTDGQISNYLYDKATR